MKCLVQTIFALFLLLPTMVFAGWQVTSPQATIPSDPFFQAKTAEAPCGPCTSSYGSAAFPNQFAMGRPASVYAISLSGSLKENLERIMDRYHWRVVWKAPYDFNFDGRVTGASLPDVIEKVMKPFPLQAKLYMSNRTMLVIPRCPCP